MIMSVRAGVALGVLAATIALPAAAQGAGLMVTGDDGKPLALTEGATAQIRYMAPKLTPTFSGSAGRYSLGVKNPRGDDAGASVSCQNVSDVAPTDAIEYSGNGTYTATLTTYADDSDLSCLNPTTSQTFSFAITAGSAVHAPGSTIMNRKPGGDTIPHRFSVDINPGAGTYDLAWRRNAPAGFTPDKGSFDAEGFDPPSAAGDIELITPGIYTFFARANAGNGSSPWSAPVVVKVIGPFDFTGAPAIHTAGSSKYELSETVTDGKQAVGTKIAISIAKGKGPFKPLGKAKIDKDGDFAFVFKKKGSGRYRVRYAYAGSNFVAKGAWIQGITLGRRLGTDPTLKKG